MTDTKEMPGDKKYFWSDDEEHIQGGPFDTKEEAYDDAYCHRAKCFDVPSSQEFFYLHYAVQVMNPDYDPSMGFDYDNFQWTLENGTTEKVDGLTVTDMFHTAWVKADTAHFPAADLERVRDILRFYAGLPTGDNWWQKVYADEGRQAKEALALLERKEKT